jgi:HD-like signal output (HDOD) protein
MQAQDAERSPLIVCVEHLQQTSGPAATPDCVMALRGKLMTDRTTLPACARIILRDLAITLRLLRIANSAMVNPSGATVKSVSHATAMLGTDAVIQLLDSIPTGAMSRPVRELAVLNQLTAWMARALMLRREPRFVEETFISGLFRNLGELSYAIEFPKEYDAILIGSRGTIAGLRASCRSHAKFDFDELTAALLQFWSLHGSMVLAAQSTPDALAAQHGNPEAEIALAASLAHLVITAYFRAEGAERDRILKPYWSVIEKEFCVHENQLADLCDSILAVNKAYMENNHVTREGMRLRTMVPEAEVPAPAVPVSTVAPAAPAFTFQIGPTVKSFLKNAIGELADRAAWIKFDDPNLRVSSVAGEWPNGGVDALPSLLNPRKPPFLMAFGHRQDVWVDFLKDDRFRDSPLAQKLHPAAFFLLPVVDGRKVRGCLYFDWADKRGTAPETVLPALMAMRDHLATNMPAA